MKSCRYSCRCGKWFEFDSGQDETPEKTLACPFCDGGTASFSPSASSATGSYKYNKKLGKLIKFSDSVPGLSGGGCAGCAGGSCSTCGH